MSLDRPRTRAAAVAVLTVLALCLRLVGIGWGLPHSPEPDAVIVRQATQLEARASGDHAYVVQLDPAYPLLLAGLVSALPDELPRVLEPPDDDVVARELARGSWPYLRARWVVALLAVLAVPLTYRLARAFLEPGWSLLAAALVATNLEHVMMSQQARPHAPLATVWTLSVLASLGLLARASLAAELRAALAAALACATLHSGLAVLPAVLAAQVLRPRPGCARAGEGPRAGRRAVWFGRALLWLLFAALAALSYPTVARWAGEAALPTWNEPAVYLPGGHLVRGEDFNGSGFLWIAAQLGTHDPVLTLLAALGAVAGTLALARKTSAVDPDRRARRLVVLAAFAPYALALGAYRIPPMRFLIPLVPALAILAAVGARFLCRRASARAALLASLGLLVVPVVGALRLVALRARPDSLTLAAEWMRAHGDHERDRVAITAITAMPLPYRPAELTTVPEWSLGPWEMHQLVRYQTALEPLAWHVAPLARQQTDAGWLVNLSAPALEAMLDQLRPRYAVVALWGAVRSERNATRPVVRARAGEPVATFDPGFPERAEHDASSYSLGFDGLARIFGSDFLGPAVEIYRFE